MGSIFLVIAARDRGSKEGRAVKGSPTVVGQLGEGFRFVVGFLGWRVSVICLWRRKGVVW